MNRPFSHAFRLVICENCGAPFDVPIAGGQAQCRYCAAVVVLAARSDEPERGPVSAAEAGGPARALRLRRQMGTAEHDDPRRHFRLVPELAGLKADEVLAMVEALFGTWKLECAEIRKHPSAEVEGRLFALALILAAPLLLRGEHEKLRAVYETTLELSREPEHRQELYASLAAAALREGDAESAEQWLHHVDAESESLEVDSSYRVARAGICLARGDFRGVLAALGDSHAAAPPTYRASLVLSGLLRAHALEALGRPADADAEVAFLTGQTFFGDAGLNLVFVVADVNRWRALAAAPVARLRERTQRTGRVVRGGVLIVSAVVGLAVSAKAGWEVGVPAGLVLPGLLYGMVIVNILRSRRFAALREQQAAGDRVRPG